MSEATEFMIILSTLHVPEFNFKVFPHLASELFEYNSFKSIFEVIRDYKNKFKDVPQIEAIKIDLETKKGMEETAYQEAVEYIDKLYAEKAIESIKKQNIEWLLSTTEKYLKDRACYNAIMESIGILDGENKKLTRDAIPDILKQAVSISFDNAIEAVSITFDTSAGHDYFEDMEKRYDYYHKVEKRIPFKLSMLNHVTEGGVPVASLVVPCASTGVGKSIFLCDEATFLIKEGYNVLFVSLELTEERVGERIDANLMDVHMSELKSMPKTAFESKLGKLKKTSVGKLIIKEYPPGTFHANHLRNLLNDLKNKKGFEPQVIMIDYLGLMASYRCKGGENSYSLYKMVAEELRGIAMEKKVAIFAPMQTNRDAISSSAPDLSNMSDSHGISMTADMIFCMIQDDNMRAMNQIRIIQWKNRFGSIDAPNSFLIGCQKSKMQFMDLDTPRISSEKIETRKDQPNEEKKSKKPNGMKF